MYVKSQWRTEWLGEEGKVQTREEKVKKTKEKEKLPESVKCLRGSRKWAQKKAVVLDVRLLVDLRSSINDTYKILTV